jgi:imidazolonepropionase-like amidohydrolase
MLLARLPGLARYAFSCLVAAASLCVVAAAIVLPAGARSASQEPAGRPLYIQADRLFNGKTLISGRVAVAVRAGKVVAAGRLRIPRGARVIRLRGATILPGFIDLHVHESPPTLLRSGVTTTRNVGASERGLRPPWTPPRHPRIVYAGPVITVPGGYPSGVYPEIAAPVSSVPEAIAKVDALVARGARVIKIAIQTGPDGRQPTLSVEQVRAIVVAAHRHRRIVTAHLPGGRELAIALAGGVDELAHMPCVDVTRDQIRVLAERRIAVVGTLHFGELFVRRQFPRCEFAATAREFVRQGGRLLYGTDIPGVPRRLDLTELGLMQKAGMTATDVLRAATADAGKQLGMAPLGALVPGAPADLWAVQGDPTDSLGVLRRPAFVMARGVRIR